MKRIDLLRHGEVHGGPRFRGHTDDPLSQAGLDQMCRAAADNTPWTAIVSSPLRRCAAFAQLLADRRGLPLRFDPRLRDLHFGEWEGKTVEEVLATTPTALENFWKAPWRCPPPGGEPLDHFRTRVLAAWQSLVDSPQSRHVLVVTHAGVIRLLLCHLKDCRPRVC